MKPAALVEFNRSIAASETLSRETARDATVSLRLALVKFPFRVVWAACTTSHPRVDEARPCFFR